mmetsp:Transcript_56241/g.163050  ORF Transcript_56241/g.163050 Transcript_56241/m.163050 type:complete len:276 (+) Transcript_56241:353-1180(+)
MALEGLRAQELTTVDVKVIAHHLDQLSRGNEVARLLEGLAVSRASRRLAPIRLAARDIVLLAVVCKPLCQEPAVMHDEAACVGGRRVLVAVVAVDELVRALGSKPRLGRALATGAGAEVRVQGVRRRLQLVERGVAREVGVLGGVEADPILHDPRHETMAHLPLHRVEAEVRVGESPVGGRLQAPSREGRRGDRRCLLLAAARGDRRGDDGRDRGRDAHGDCDAEAQQGRPPAHERPGLLGGLWRSYRGAVLLGWAAGLGVNSDGLAQSAGGLLC